MMLLGRLYKIVSKALILVYKIPVKPQASSFLALSNMILYYGVTPVTDKINLNVETLVKEAAAFAETQGKYDEPALYGVTDGKAVGTYLEHKFTSYLVEALNKSILDFSRPLVPDAALPPASMQARARKVKNAISTLLQNQ